MRRNENIIRGQVYVDVWPEPELVLFEADMGSNYFVSESITGCYWP